MGVTANEYKTFLGIEESMVMVAQLYEHTKNH